MNARKTTEPRLLKLAEVERLLNLKRRAINGLADRGHLRRIRLSKNQVRFTRDSVERFLKSDALVG